MNNYNVIGSVETLNEMLSNFPSVRIDEKFSKTDWLVQVPEDVEDDFTDYLDDGGIEYKMV